MGHHQALTRRGVRHRSRALALIGNVAAVVGATALAATASTASTAGERPAGAGGMPKVTICHATGRRTNPYVRITVDVHAILAEGHGAHGGPLLSPDLAAHERWGDVVPPFDLGAGARYDGLNWTAAGRALLAGSCGVPGHGAPGTRPAHPGPTPPAGPGPGASRPGGQEPVASDGSRPPSAA